LSCREGRLHYRAPKGALTPKELEELRSLSGQIVALLEQSDDRDSGPIRAPLTFSQRAHWNFYQLERRPAVRQLASATRLSGHLHIEALQRSIEQTARRHAALRTRIVVCDGEPLQEISESSDLKAEIVDVTGLAQQDRQAEVMRHIERLIMQPIDVSEGPLVGITLLKTAIDEHVLIIAMEHTISDAVSLGILLSELLNGYAQAVQGQTLSVPAPVQFMDVAISQRRGFDSWLKRHGAYWEAHIRACSKVTLPRDVQPSSDNRPGWGKAPIHIGAELKTQLRQWCRQRRTTLVMSVFTAYAAVISRWSGTSEVVIPYQTDGRTDSSVTNTIGFLAAVLYPRIELLETDSFVDLLNKAVDEYCRAHEHADSYYLETRTPKPGFLSNPAFNWVPPGSPSGFSELDGTPAALSLEAVSFEHPMLRTLSSDNEPLMLLYESEEAIDGGILFPLSRFSTQSMERLVRHFMVLLRTLLSHPDRRVSDIPLA